MPMAAIPDRSHGARPVADDREDTGRPADDGQRCHGRSPRRDTSITIQHDADAQAAGLQLVITGTLSVT
jgi:hypothetical protein